MRFIKSTILLALAATAGTARAQVADTLSLEGRSFLSVGIGLTGTRDAQATAGNASAHSTGQLGSFALTHYAQSALAVEISASALDADAHAGFGAAHQDVIAAVLFGLSYSPRVLALSPSIRPFVSVAAGPYLHVVSDASGYSGARSTSQSQMGARLGAGANWFVSRHFVVRAESDYHAVGKFAAVNGLTKQPSGFGMSAGFGFVWGGR